VIPLQAFAAALRGHQAAVDATKSPHREASKNASSVGLGSMHPLFASSYVLSKGKDMLWWRKQEQAG